MNKVQWFFFQSIDFVCINIDLLYINYVTKYATKYGAFLKTVWNLGVIKNSL